MFARCLPSEDAFYDGKQSFLHLKCFSGTLLSSFSCSRDEKRELR